MLEMKSSFEGLKEPMCPTPVVVHTPDFSTLFVLQTDASGNALGAMLLQKWGEEEHPIAFAMNCPSPPGTPDPSRWIKTMTQDGSSLGHVSAAALAPAPMWGT
ncbi:hypothetical protein Y1Q_0008850 [Alligator mississippiensis]|uniref:Reverse transcriptase/retrotransposon-derived protein RNase H-like domain-containing protein n=1 Tax=Alligator mississippiensis TaxID=8496 RepID=A0A151NA87_ALLMI|nr:hypothetical protein Y1Q_0008850 [Alligator mississippiensis]